MKRKLTIEGSGLLPVSKGGHIRCYTNLILFLLSGMETPISERQLLVNDSYITFLINTVYFNDIVWYI